MVSSNDDKKWLELESAGASGVPSSLQLSRQQTAGKGHIIKAKRSEDGAVTFNLSVSHIIEQVVVCSKH